MPFWSIYTPQAFTETTFVLVSYLNVLKIYLNEWDYYTFVRILNTLYGLQCNDPDGRVFRRSLRQLVQPHPVLHPGFDVFVTHEDPIRHPNFLLLLMQFRLLRTLSCYPLGCRSLIERPVREHVKFYLLGMSFTAHGHSALLHDDYVSYLQAWFNFHAGRWTYYYFRDEIRRLSQDTELVLGNIIFKDLLDSTLPDEGELRPLVPRTTPPTINLHRQ